MFVLFMTMRGELRCCSARLSFFVFYYELTLLERRRRLRSLSSRALCIYPWGIEFFLLLLFTITLGNSWLAYCWRTLWACLSLLPRIIIPACYPKKFPWFWWSLGWWAPLPGITPVPATAFSFFLKWLLISGVLFREFDFALTRPTIWLVKPSLLATSSDIAF